VEEKIRGTTILSVRRGSAVALGGDGQVTLGNVAIKHGAKKIRRLHHDRVITGFSGSSADSFALLERYSSKLERHQGNVLRSAHELAREWRTDRMLRRLESLLVVVDKEHSLLISGSGDVIEPDDGIIGVGSGGPLAVAAARALMQKTDLSARDITETALKIAAEMCIYTNDRIIVEELT